MANHKIEERGKQKEREENREEKYLMQDNRDMKEWELVNKIR